MRSQSPSLAPSRHANDVTVHIVLDDFSSLGRAYETDEADADEKTIIENFVAGQYSNPLRVVAFNIAEGWARDVSEDIAHTVLSRARSEQRPLGTAAQEFVERALAEDVADGYAASTSAS
jgi:hypothetical protein